MEVKPELWGAMGSYVSSCGLAAGGLVAVAVQRGAAGVSKWGMDVTISMTHTHITHIPVHASLTPSHVQYI